MSDLKRVLKENKFIKLSIGCDWCGSKSPVSHTSFGTTNYTRVICKECAKKFS